MPPCVCFRAYLVVPANLTQQLMTFRPEYIVCILHVPIWQFQGSVLNVWQNEALLIIKLTCGKFPLAFFHRSLSLGKAFYIISYMKLWPSSCWQNTISSSLNESVWLFIYFKTCSDQLYCWFYNDQRLSLWLWQGFLRKLNDIWIDLLKYIIFLSVDQKCLHCQILISYNEHNSWCTMFAERVLFISLFYTKKNSASTLVFSFSLFQMWSYSVPCQILVLCLVWHYVIEPIMSTVVTTLCIWCYSVHSRSVVSVGLVGKDIS